MIYCTYQPAMTLSSNNRKKVSLHSTIPFIRVLTQRNKQILYLIKLIHDKICPKGLAQNQEVFAKNY